MKGKNVIGEARSSSSSSKRKGKRKECEIDRISNLPDSVLAHVLSFLPTQDAVKTSLLRRFGLLWTTSDNLQFDACSFHDCEDLRYYSDKNDGPRYKRTLEARNFFKREMRLASEINTWTRFALRREVKVLDLDFLACSDVDEPEILYKIPDFVFNCDSIRELKLVYCKVEPQGQILMRSLRTLFLKHVALDNTKIEEILSGFPLLENLSLIKCYNLCKFNFVSLNLKYLKVVARNDCSRLEISGPNIISLDISGSVGQVDLKNLSSLKDAALGIMYRFSCSEDENHEAMKILENLNSAKVLTIYEQSIQLWTAWELMKISFPSLPEKHLILNTDLSKEHLPGIVSMLRSSPSLEMLDIHIVKSYFVFPDFLKRELDAESYWSKLDESPQDLPHNLQTVRIHGSVAEPFVVQLVQFLLKNLFGLEKMVITFKMRSNGSDPKSCVTSDELVELFQKLPSFPRASSSAVVLFS